MNLIYLFIARTKYIFQDSLMPKSLFPPLPLSLPPSTTFLLPLILLLPPYSYPFPLLMPLIPPLSYPPPSLLPDTIWPGIMQNKGVGTTANPLLFNGLKLINVIQLRVRWLSGLECGGGCESLRCCFGEVGWGGVFPTRIGFFL